MDDCLCGRLPGVSRKRGHGMASHTVHQWGIRLPWCCSVTKARNQSHEGVRFTTFLDMSLGRNSCVQSV